VADAGKREIWWRALGRVSGRTLRGSRVVNAGIAGASTTLKSTGRAVNTLWLQVTGFFFAVFSLIFAGTAWREYQRSLQGTAAVWKWWLAAGVAVLFLYFAVTAFWRARRRG
jgi:uncharacterized membrane protein